MISRKDQQQNRCENKWNDGHNWDDVEKNMRENLKNDEDRRNHLFNEKKPYWLESNTPKWRWEKKHRKEEEIHETKNVSEHYQRKKKWNRINKWNEVDRNYQRKTKMMKKSGNN